VRTKKANKKGKSKNAILKRKAEEAHINPNIRVKKRIEAYYPKSGNRDDKENVLREVKIEHDSD
jgi:hypothetical protein